MRAVVTVIGKDKVGIIAGICQCLADLNVNVLDISQTILQDLFTMNMLVDISLSEKTFPEIVSALNAEGESLGVSVRIQREDIFDAMHRF